MKNKLDIADKVFLIVCIVAGVVFIFALATIVFAAYMSLIYKGV